MDLNSFVFTDSGWGERSPGGTPFRCQTPKVEVGGVTAFLSSDLDLGV